MEHRDLSRFVNPAHTLQFPYKIFVKGAETSNDTHNVRRSSSTLKKKTLSGKETKSFYESVVNDDIPQINSNVYLNAITTLDSASNSSNSTNHIYTSPSFQSNDVKRKSSEALVLSKKQILLAVENDDSKVLETALQKGWEKEILYERDRYGWTLLMIAACAGSLETVKILIDKGASVNEKDKSGNTCLSLATKNRHHKVVNYINLYISGRIKKAVNSNIKDKKQLTEVFVEKYCELCCVTFQSDRLSRQHFTSTIHLLNLEKKEIEDNGGNPKVHYGIPQANRGFQMMLSKGWDSNVGLGPSGKGKLYPVKTVLKRDKHGLGLETSDSEPRTCKKAKVTHFGPYDLSSVKSKQTDMRTESTSTLSKKERIKKTNKSKIKERDFRREFTSL